MDKFIGEFGDNKKSLLHILSTVEELWLLKRYLWEQLDHQDTNCHLKNFSSGYYPQLVVLYKGRQVKIMGKPKLFSSLDVESFFGRVPISRRRVFITVTFQGAIAQGCKEDHTCRQAALPLFPPGRVVTFCLCINRLRNTLAMKLLVVS